MSRMSTLMKRVYIIDDYAFGESLCTWLIHSRKSDDYCTQRHCNDCLMDRVSVKQAELVKAYEGTDP